MMTMHLLITYSIYILLFEQYIYILLYFINKQKYHLVSSVSHLPISLLSLELKGITKEEKEVLRDKLIKDHI